MNEPDVCCIKLYLTSRPFVSGISEFMRVSQAYLMSGVHGFNNSIKNTKEIACSNVGDQK